MGEYSINDLIKELEKNSVYNSIIELLKDKTDLKDLKIKYDEGDDPLCIAIKNTALWKKLSLEGKNLLIKESDLDYVYNGPFDKTKQKIIGDSYLHTAARARNVDAFVFICKQDITLVTHKNDDKNNPFHEASKHRILFPAVKSVLGDIRSNAQNQKSRIEHEIKKAKEVNDREKLKNLAKALKSLDKKLKCDEQCIKDALHSKKYALNKDGKTSLDDLYEKNEIMKIAGIKDSLICNKKLHSFIYMTCAIVCITALCLSLYFLFLANSPFALSSIASMAVAGTAFFSLKAGNEMLRLSEGGEMDGIAVSSAAEGVGNDLYA